MPDMPNAGPAGFMMIIVDEPRRLRSNPFGCSEALPSDRDQSRTAWVCGTTKLQPDFPRKYRSPCNVKLFPPPPLLELIHIN